MIRYLISIVALNVLAIVVGLQSASAKTHLVVVVGAEGEPQYGERFQIAANEWSAVAKRADATIDVIGVDADSHGIDLDRLHHALQKIADSDAASVWLVMIGHGTSMKDDAKFNLRGPDVSAKQLAGWLKDISMPMVIVNGGSASGPFINQLSAKNRIVLTATKSGMEDNYARFSEYFAATIAATEADLDHDDEVSLLEAFLLASSQTNAFYTDEGRISTEHALLDDNGDGLGTPARMFDGVYAKSPKDTTKKADGTIAAKTILVPSSQSLIFTDDELAQREKIEQQLTELRNQRKALIDAEYLNQLETLLVPLAKIYHEAQARTDAK